MNLIRKLWMKLKKEQVIVTDFKYQQNNNKYKTKATVLYTKTFRLGVGKQEEVIKIFRDRYSSRWQSKSDFMIDDYLLVEACLAFYKNEGGQLEDSYWIDIYEWSRNTIDFANSQPNRTSSFYTLPILENSIYPWRSLNYGTN